MFCEQTRDLYRQKLTNSLEKTFTKLASEFCVLLGQSSWNQSTLPYILKYPPLECIFLVSLKLHPEEDRFKKTIKDEIMKTITRGSLDGGQGMFITSNAFYQPIPVEDDVQAQANKIRCDHFSRLLSACRATKINSPVQNAEEMISWILLTERYTYDEFRSDLEHQCNTTYGDCTTLFSNFDWEMSRIDFENRNLDSLRNDIKNLFWECHIDFLENNRLELHQIFDSFMKEVMELPKQDDWRSIRRQILDMEEYYLCTTRQEAEISSSVDDQESTDNGGDSEETQDSYNIEGFDTFFESIEIRGRHKFPFSSESSTPSEKSCGDIVDNFFDLDGSDDGSH